MDRSELRLGEAEKPRLQKTRTAEQRAVAHQDPVPSQQATQTMTRVLAPARASAWSRHTGLLRIGLLRVTCR